MIHVCVFNAHPKKRIHPDKTVNMVRRVLRGEGKSNAEINIIIVNNRAMRTLNSTYLRHQYTTDVLSFPLDESKKHLEGEVYVNLDLAVRQAHEYKVSRSTEFNRLVIHGVLHLVGYRDKTSRDKCIMTEREDYYLSTT